MAKCKEHDWQICEQFPLCLRVCRKWVCAKCGAAKFTAKDGGNEYEIPEALFHSYYQDYLNDR